MRIAICEDEKPSQKRLAEAIWDWADARKIEIEILCYNNAEAFMMLWPDISFDLAFLDVEMKDMTGVDLAHKIRENDKNMMIVFVTSYEQYVLKGYDVEALHYMIKPLSSAKLLPILDKAHIIWRSRQNEILVASDKSGQYRVAFSDIVYISMSAHIAEVHTMNGVYSLRKTAKELVGLLPSHFIRCHRSYIVNLFKVDCVLGETVLLCTQTELPLSRKNTKEVKEAFMRLQMM
ncbi:MAG: LytTR family DNA-binding domain-containing protein [Oscillospiraceae bacterium]|nr:LytTR family DNA-binding domain-containing protein [Oscillospiraceae bacterium]